MKLCILMGSANISGGSNVIFQHALYAQSRGVEVTIVTLESLDLIKTQWHVGLKELTFKTFEQIDGETFDLTLATWWKTVYELPRVKSRQYAYFVQSIESWFYPDSDVAVRNLANATYLLDLPVITEAGWIKDHLHKLYGTNAHLVRNGIDKTIFSSDGPRAAPRRKDGIRVLIDGPLGIDFKNVARAIKMARRANAAEIWLLTISPINQYPGVDRVFSQIPLEKCAEIYRSCDVLVKLSYVEGMFGPPLEMFHCGGTAVVYDVSGFDEYIVDNENALVVKTGDEEAAIRAISRLQNSPHLMTRLKAKALETAQDWPDWSVSSPLFLESLEAILKEAPSSVERIKVLTDEFMRQYVRVAKTQKTKVGDFSGIVERIKREALQRYPNIGKYIMPLFARFIESRTNSAPRDKI